MNRTAMCAFFLKLTKHAVLCFYSICAYKMNIFFCSMCNTSCDMFLLNALFQNCLNLTCYFKSLCLIIFYEIKIITYCIYLHVVFKCYIYK